MIRPSWCSWRCNCRCQSLCLVLVCRSQYNFWRGIHVFCVLSTPFVLLELLPTQWSGPDRKKNEEHVVRTLELLSHWCLAMVFLSTDNKCLVLCHRFMCLWFISAQQVVSNAKGEASDWQHQQGCTQWLSLPWPLNSVLHCQKNSRAHVKQAYSTRANDNGKLCPGCYADT